MLNAWGERLERVALQIIPRPPVLPGIGETKGARDDLLGEQILKLAPSDEVREHLEKVAQDNYARIHSETIDGLDATIGLVIDPSDPLSARIMAEGGRRMGLVDLDKAAKKKLFKTLEEMRLIGEGPEAIARRIREEIPAGPWRTPKIRARVIARTETLHAQRKSQLACAESAGVKKVMIFDDRIGYGDDVCSGLNGTVVGIGEANLLMGAEHPNGTRSFSPHYDPNDGPIIQEDARLQEGQLDFEKLVMNHANTDKVLKAHSKIRGYVDYEKTPGVLDYMKNDFYEGFGRAMRGEIQMTSKYTEVNSQMFDASVKLHSPLRVFRGEPLSIIDDVPLQQGQIYSPSSWTSTATAAQRANRFAGGPYEKGRMWDIRVPGGQRAVVTQPELGEVVLPPNTKLRILRVDKWDDAITGELDFPVYRERVIAEVVDVDTAAKIIDDTPTVLHSLDDATHLAKRADEAERYLADAQKGLNDLIADRNAARQAMKTAADPKEAKREYLRINGKVQKQRKLTDAAFEEASEARKASDTAQKLAEKLAKPAVADVDPDEVARLTKLADEADGRAQAIQAEVDSAIASRTQAREIMHTAVDKDAAKREYLKRNARVQQLRKRLKDAESEAGDARKLANDTASGSAATVEPPVPDVVKLLDDLAESRTELAALKKRDDVLKDLIDKERRVIREAAARGDYIDYSDAYHKRIAEYNGSLKRQRDLADRAKDLEDRISKLPPNVGQADAPEWVRKMKPHDESVRDHLIKDLRRLAEEGKDGWKLPENVRPGTHAYIGEPEIYKKLNAKLRSGQKLTDEERAILRDLLDDSSEQAGFTGYRGVRMRKEDIPKVGESDLLAPTSISKGQDTAIQFGSDWLRPDLEDTVGVVYRVDVADGVKQARIAHSLDEIVVMPGYRMQITKVTKLDVPIDGLEYAVDAKIVKIDIPKPKPRPKVAAKPKEPPKLARKPGTGEAIDTLEDLKAAYTKPDIDHYADLHGLTDAQRRAYKAAVGESAAKYESTVERLLKPGNYVSDADSEFFSASGKSAKLRWTPSGPKAAKHQGEIMDRLEAYLPDHVRAELARRDITVTWRPKLNAEAIYDANKRRVFVNAKQADVSLIAHELTHALDDALGIQRPASEISARFGTNKIGVGASYVTRKSGTRLALLRESMDFERKLREAARHAKLGKSAGARVSDGFSNPIWKQYETRRYGGADSLASTHTIEYQTVNAEALSIIRQVDDELAKGDKVHYLVGDQVARITGDSRWYKINADWKDDYLKWRGKKMAEWQKESPEVKKFVEAMYGKPAGVVDDLATQQAAIDIAQDTAKVAGAREATERVAKETAERQAREAASRAAAAAVETERKALLAATQRSQKQAIKAEKAQAASIKAREQVAETAAKAKKADEALETASVKAKDLRKIADDEIARRDGWKSKLTKTGEDIKVNRRRLKELADEQKALEKELVPAREGLPERVGDRQTIQPGTDRVNIYSYNMNYSDFENIQGYQKYNELPPGVHDYHGNTYYKRVNKANREGKRLTGKIKEIDDDLQSAMKEMPEDRLVWRGENYNPNSAAAWERYRFLQHLEPGEILNEGQYMSTSMNMATSMVSPFGELTVSRKATVAFQIHIRKGSKTIISNAGEREIIINRGERLRVLSKPKIKKLRYGDRGGRPYDALVIDVEVLAQAGADDASKQFNKLRKLREDVDAIDEKITESLGDSARFAGELEKAGKKAETALKRAATADTRLAKATTRAETVKKQADAATTKLSTTVDDAIAEEAERLRSIRDAARVPGKAPGGRRKGESGLACRRRDRGGGGAPAIHTGRCASAGPRGCARGEGSPSRCRQIPVGRRYRQGQESRRQSRRGCGEGCRSCGETETARGGVDAPGSRSGYGDTQGHPGRGGCTQGAARGRRCAEGCEQSACRCRCRRGKGEGGEGACGWGVRRTANAGDYQVRG